MNRNITRTLLWIFAFIALMLGLLLQKVFSPKQLTREQYRDYGAILFDKPRQFADFSLTDHNGQAFTLENLKGHWTILTFGFTHCPDICPTNLSTLNQVRQELKDTEFLKDTAFMMLTVDPERDTQEVLANYMPFFNESFVGLTGELSEVSALAANLYIAFNKISKPDSDNYNVDHSGDIAIINPYGHYHGIFKFPHDAKKMATAYSYMRAAF